MLAALLLGMSVQTVSADTIKLVHPRPTETITASKTFTCGETDFELVYSQTSDGVTGTLTARTGDEVLNAESIQIRLFDHLSHIAGSSVTCEYEELPAQILVMGTDRESGEYEQLYQLNHTESDGFTEVRGPRNRT